MADTPQLALTDTAARQLANATKSVPQLSTITPRWLTHLRQGIPVEASIYRLNQVADPGAVKLACAAAPRNDFLSAGATVLAVHTRA
jgi:hypothetical protein